MAHHDIRIAKLFILGAMVVDSDVDGIFLRETVEKWKGCDFGCADHGWYADVLAVDKRIPDGFFIVRKRDVSCAEGGDPGIHPLLVASLALSRS